MYAAVMPVASRNICVYLKQYIVCAAETLQTLLGRFTQRPDLVCMYQMIQAG